MSPNFTECGIKFTTNSATIYSNYSYTGRVYGAIDAGEHRPALITLSGCEHLCGLGSQNYEWSAAANTITTWVLPVIGGLLLQAPFESNRFWRTVFAISRWVGSPISSLTYVLWNIKVTGKCALMVDMSTKYDEVPGETSEFAQMRDSFYILAVMNQYAIKPRMPGVEAERLLRVALFSDSLKLSVDHTENASLVKQRDTLASYLRAGRRRGIVPVFVSFLWFLFSLGLSLQAAFGELGENATAHNLALGLLLGWLPVFVMGSIVDRNPMGPDDIRQKLNILLDQVRHALLNPQLRNTYMRDTHRTEDDFAWTEMLQNDDYWNEFFIDFAGQGRSRWHYGVAHPILAGIENAYVAEYGRDWLNPAELARTKLVMGPKIIRGVRWFDFRELWQIASAFVIVLGTVGGAFCISYFTPTVGLGCRSGGYMIFLVLAIFSFSVEMLVWWQVSSNSAALRRASIPQRLESLRETVSPHLSHHDSDSWSYNFFKFWSWAFHLPLYLQIEYFFLRPVDFVNTCWLVYIVLAQTFGWYRTCRCMASVWGGRGGYLDFEDMDYYRAHGVILYWGSGTALSVSVLTFAVVFIVIEWCEQSHLSTENYGNASRGLRRTRRWKNYTSFLRRFPDFFILGVKHLRRMLFGAKFRYGRRSLVWARAVTKHDPLLVYGQPVNDDEDDLHPLGKGSSQSITMKDFQSTPPSHSYSRARGDSMGGPRIEINEAASSSSQNFGYSRGREESLAISPRGSNEALAQSYSYSRERDNSLGLSPQPGSMDIGLSPRGSNEALSTQGSALSFREQV